jgi:3-(3-hydroxy-phenyl)propionate hydroxylase
VSRDLVVVGAGPVGTVLALAAAERGFGVTVLEAAEEVTDAPRAATMHPSTLDMIADLGLLDEVRDQGLTARYFDYWDRPTRTLIARMDHELLREDTPHPYVVQVEQHKVVGMALRRLAALDGVDVRFGTPVTGVEQDGGRVTAHTADGPVHGDYLVGTDGGRSTVRKSLGVEFAGYTWPERFLVLTTLFDFQQEWAGCSYRNYIFDPDEWVNLFKVAGNDGAGRWRAVFPTSVDETDEQALGDEGAWRRLGGLSTGAHPAEQLVHRNLYNVHQRVAERFRDGRVFLAGDAAHVNNPVGGLGLNCGIHDAVELADTLDAAASATGAVAAEAALDRYEARRRPVNIEFVQQQTVANKRRLEEKDPAKRRAAQQELATIAADPDRTRAFLRNTSLLNSVARARSLA